MIKVSVIIPVKNSEKTILKTLNSLKSQRLKNLEVIIVDDCSTDSTYDIVKRFIGTNKNYSLISSNGEGLAASRNIGLNYSKGKYIVFFSSGNTCTKNFLWSMYETAERLNAELTIGKIQSIDTLGVHKFDSARELVNNGLTDKYDFNLIWNPSLSNKMFLKSKIFNSSLRLNECGAVQEAVFSLSFAFHCDVIASCSKGGVYMYSNTLETNYTLGLADFNCYLHGYDIIRTLALNSLKHSVQQAQNDFELSELKHKQKSYIDELYLKELTILMYRYYRRMHFLTKEEVKTVSDTIMRLSAQLSEDKFKTFMTMNEDVFVDGVLADSPAKLMEHPRFTITINGIRTSKDLSNLIDSIFRQTMPAFEIIADEKLKTLIEQLYPQRECIRYIKSENPVDFKQKALNEAISKYILFIDEPCILAPKTLQRNYKILLNNKKIGFTTTPLAHFDGQKVEPFKFCDASFYRNEDAMSIAGAPFFPFDLFLYNKFFKVSHLKGIKFHFSDSSVLDAYTLYRNSSFIKMQKNCVYLARNENSLLTLLKSNQDLLPPECSELYKRARRLYSKRWRKSDNNTSKNIKMIRKKLYASYMKFNYRLFCILPIKKRVVFYTQNDSLKPSENMRRVIEKLPNVNNSIIAVQPKSYLSLKDMRILLTSKVIVADGYMDILLKIKKRDKQFLLQLWNSAGAFKRFGLDADNTRSKITERKLHEQYSAVCVTSEECKQYYSHALNLPYDKFLNIGRPDTDRLMSNLGKQTLRDKIYKKHPLLKDKKIYLYCPTFREAEGHKIKFEPNINWARIENSLDDNEIFLIHRHPVMHENLLRGKFYPNVKDYSSEPLNELLSVADVLITDYSSVMFDGVLLNLPIVFYCPDIKKYNRNFYVRYPIDLPGNVTENGEELIDTIRKSIKEGVSPKAEDFKKRHLSSCDGHSTQRVVDLILEKLQ